MRLKTWNDITATVRSARDDGRFVDIILALSCPLCQETLEYSLGAQAADAWMWPLDGRSEHLEDQALFKGLAKLELLTCPRCGVPSAIDVPSQTELKEYFKAWVTTPAAIPRHHCASWVAEAFDDWMKLHLEGSLRFQHYFNSCGIHHQWLPKVCDCKRCISHPVGSPAPDPFGASCQ